MANVKGYGYGSPHHYGQYGGYRGWGRAGQRRGWRGGSRGGPRWSWMGADSLTSPMISWAQSCLAQILGPWVQQDGTMGLSTRHAIQQFQSQQQLPVSGVLDSNTVEALQAACSGQQAGGVQPGGPSTPPPQGEAGESEFEFEAEEGLGQNGRWIRRHGRIVVLGV